MEYPLVFTAAIALTILGAIAFIIVRLIKKDEEDIHDNMFVILYNKRTKQIKEVNEKDYVASASWEKVTTTYNSSFNDFIKYLRKNHIVTTDEPPLFKGRPSRGAYELKKWFTTFIY